MQFRLSRPASGAAAQLTLDGTQLRHSPFSARCRSTHSRAVCAAEPDQQQQQPDKQDLVRSLPKVRQAAPPPEAVAVQHSSSYLYRQRRQELGEDPDMPPRSYTTSERPWREGAEDINAAAASGIANAAKVTADVSGKVLSVAVPVGGWALRQGFKAARGALKRNSSNQPSSTKRRQRRDADDSD